MSHAERVHIDVAQVIKAPALGFSEKLSSIMLLCIAFGVGIFSIGLLTGQAAQTWGALFTNVVFWLGLSVGCVMIAVITQIVKANWVLPIRRLAEANISFVWFAWAILLFTYLGKDHLFYWGSHPMPGREWWMQPTFVFARHGVCLAFLLFCLGRWVKLSLRRDVGTARERLGSSSRWAAWQYDRLTSGWKGEEKEVALIEEKLAFRAPVMVMLYMVFYSLFSFEMIMGMDPVFFSNMFGGFVFIGNIYAGWAVLGLITIFIRLRSKELANHVKGQQFWDLGKLTFAFGVLWAYLFFAQFLPIWYGNLPEETQWLILRTRENPWRLMSWAAFGMCFVMPFIMLLSRDIKKVTGAFGAICVLILCGLWLERYILIMPQITPDHVPFNYLEVGIFLGFLGGYVLCMQSFLAKYPIMVLRGPEGN